MTVVSVEMIFEIQAHSASSQILYRTLDPSSFDRKVGCTKTKTRERGQGLGSRKAVYSVKYGPILQ